MSSLVLRNLAPDIPLDRRALAAIRGGSGNPHVAVSIPISVTQTNNMEQRVAVLNHSSIGAGVGLDGVQVRPTQIGFNALALPARFL